MRKRIVLVHNTTKYINMHYREFVEMLLGRGAEVICVAPRDDSAADLEKIGVRCRNIYLTRKGINPLSEFGGWLGLHTIIRQEKPDMVFNYSIKPVIYGSLAARAAGVKYIFSMITGLGYVFMGETVRQRFLESLVSRSYRWALRCNQRVFFQNRDDRDLFVQRRFVDAGKAVVVNGTGIDTDRYRPGEEQPEGFVFLMVARLLRDKGVYEFVEAARKLKREYSDVAFQLLGPVDENPTAVSKDEIRRWEQEGVIRYLGAVADVRPYLSRATVFVLPSYREGLPRATLEALAMGKPVVTTDVSGCRETVRDEENGFLVSPKDSDALARAMRRFIESPSLVEEMGRKSRLMAVRRFDVHKVNKQIIDRISEIVES